MKDRARWAISCLVPDLPPADALLPRLREIDANRWYTNFGPLVARYEAELVRFCDQTFPAAEKDAPLLAVTFATGTAALTLALRGLDLAPGGRVLLPAFTFPATLLAVREAGLTPVLADVDGETWMLEPGIAGTALRKQRIDAVLPVAAFGYPADLSSWARFRADTGVPVLLDAAAGLGMQPLDGPRSAAGGPIDIPVVFSLHATKPLGAGEGGVLLTRNGALAERVRRLSNFGFERWIVREPGTNAKLSEYHAAVGLTQLARAASLLDRRRQVLAEYRSLLPDALFRRPAAADRGGVVPAVLPLRTGGRATQVTEHLGGQGIETRRWYHPPLHRHAAFHDVERVAGAGGLAMSENLGEELVGVPFHNFLERADIRRVADALLRALEDARARPASA